MRREEEARQLWKYLGLLLVAMHSFNEKIIFTAAGLWLVVLHPEGVDYCINLIFQALYKWVTDLEDQSHLCLFKTPEMYSMRATAQIQEDDLIFLVKCCAVALCISGTTHALVFKRNMTSSLKLLRLVKQFYDSLQQQPALWIILAIILPT